MLLPGSPSAHLPLHFNKIKPIHTVDIKRNAVNIIVALPSSGQCKTAFYKIQKLPLK